MESLDLDKAWGLLQQVLAHPAGEQKRPAYEFVYRGVEARGFEHRSFVRVLTVSQVAEAAADLLGVGECEVMEGLSPQLEHYEEDVEYTLHYLALAKDYLEEVASRGLGLAYVIG